MYQFLIFLVCFPKILQVILEVAPESLYNEIFTKVFRNSLFLLSSHQCANFVVQALVSHARDQDQVRFYFSMTLKSCLFSMGGSSFIFLN